VKLLSFPALLGFHTIERCFSYCCALGSFLGPTVFTVVWAARPHFLRHSDSKDWMTMNRFGRILISRSSSSFFFGPYGAAPEFARARSSLKVHVSLFPRL